MTAVYLSRQWKDSLCAGLTLHRDGTFLQEYAFPGDNLQQYDILAPIF
jgi:hypothetical protein